MCKAGLEQEKTRNTSHALAGLKHQDADLRAALASVLPRLAANFRRLPPLMLQLPLGELVVVEGLELGYAPVREVLGVLRELGPVQLEQGCEERLLHNRPLLDSGLGRE